MRAGAAHINAINIEDIGRHFANNFSKLWLSAGSPSRLGLAISGGVDSMALASLCRNYAREHNPGLVFNGFIVDHGVRKGSRDEALRVANTLKRIQIESRILTLDWTSHSKPGSLRSFETVARRLRYQALGRACSEAGIKPLLVGHHAGDQAETVLLRICANYTGTGLQSIRSSVKIPECDGVYGADASGEPWQPAELNDQEDDAHSGMLIESGGVVIHRPLLSFSKQHLIDTCQNAGIGWFEDPTNADKGLTLRNTIRHLLQTAELPFAIQTQNLQKLAESQVRQTDLVEDEARRLFKQMSVELDLRWGRLTVTLNRSLDNSTRSAENDYHVKAALLRRLILLVSPTTNVSLQTLDKAVDRCFSDSIPSQDSYANKDYTVNVASVSIQPQIEEGTANLTNSFILQRQNPVRRELQKMHFGWRSTTTTESDPYNMTNSSGQLFWSNWLLWDNRYWLRVGLRQLVDTPPSLRVSVSFLSPTALGALRQSLDWESRADLTKKMAGKGSSSNRTLPAISIETGEGSEISALPSVGWSRGGWQRWEHDREDKTEVAMFWEIRYKAIDFTPTACHRIVV